MRAKPEILDFRRKARVKTYRQHNCSRQHRNETTFLECALGTKVNWIAGVGQYASISWCNGRRRRGHYATVILCETLEDARHRKAEIDYIACGGGCERKHQVVRVEIRSY
ncbi:hypothetical protein MGALJ_39560 [Mycobacterium gallinarum]|uniref:Uncharacterized protein n=1 Tax=Mycobacterium gallinarum TaxID=39689 RepID=A0A9W4FGG6_9MYCO|nr:hypothetical protein MGALJ_39560 [Mycobacterium gallinarum]